MILTVFGDVHGNLIALEKMFDIEKSQTDLFVCHGDVVNYGPWTNECIAFLQNISNIKLLKGNHEKYFLNGNYDGTNEIAKAFFIHNILNFDKKLTQTINNYNDFLEINNFKIQHTILDKYIFFDTDISDLIIENHFIIGHSHQQFERKINNFNIFNTGSLGQNRQFINQSCYLKFNTETLKIELKTFIHDIDLLINQMISEKYPKICIDYYLSKNKI
jgi:predicted phosphodiesterase